MKHNNTKRDKINVVHSNIPTGGPPIGITNNYMEISCEFAKTICTFPHVMIVGLDITQDIHVL